MQTRYTLILNCKFSLRPWLLEHTLYYSTCVIIHYTHTHTSTTWSVSANYTAGIPQYHMRLLAFLPTTGYTSNSRGVTFSEESADDAGCVGAIVHCKKHTFRVTTLPLHAGQKESCQSYTGSDIILTYCRQERAEVHSLSNKNKMLVNVSAFAQSPQITPWNMSNMFYFLSCSMPSSGQNAMFSWLS